MEGFAVSKGDRGEFLALLLFTLARDEAVGPADALGRPTSGKRWCLLSGFLYGHLFRKQKSSSVYVDKNSIRALKHLAKDFPSAQLYFNHYIKVHEFKAIGLTSLLLMMGRGSGVLCANNQAAIDALSVFLCRNTTLVENNAGLIFVQAKNDSSYTNTPRPELQAAMDPYKLGILDSNDPAIPVIKITFALAAKTPGLHVVRHKSDQNYNAVVYEIWCAGLSPEILQPISTEYIGMWNALLQASYGWKELYKGGSKVAQKLRRTANPGAGLDDAHYSRWARR
jgi:hypothetical protein